MSDHERREKYAAALYEFNTEGVWPPDNDRESWLEAADAVTAVANAEQKELRGWLTSARAATRSYKDENARVCSDCEWYDTERVMWLNEAHGLMAVIERVRAVLDGDPGWSSEGLKGRLRSALLGAPDAGS